MASARRHIWISRPPDRVWEIVGDPAAITRWFPNVIEVEVDVHHDIRVVTLANGLALREQIVTVSSDLRRFQYRLLGPLPVTSHLGTVDVIADGQRSLVIYSTDVIPHALGPVLDGATGDALASLRDLLEAS